MRKSFVFAIAATAISMSAATAQAGGLIGNSSQSAGLINVSPSIQTGNVSVLSGILNGSPIASGNVVSGILSGNGVLTGNNTGVGILGLGSGLIKTTKKH